MIDMNEAILSICSLLALHGSADTACITTLPVAYHSSAISSPIEAEQKVLEKKGAKLLKGHETLSAASIIGYETIKKDFKIPLDNQKV